LTVADLPVASSFSIEILKGASLPRHGLSALRMIREAIEELFGLARP
jgi:hypothetical protein